jgi:hypothetical protein
MQLTTLLLFFQTLAMINLQAIGKHAFDCIVHSSNLSRLQAVGHPDLLNDPVMLDKLSNKLDLKVCP